MGKTVYVVTSGEYSDYEIEAIFSDINKAELYCATHKYTQIEEYEMDNEQIEGKVYKAITFRANKVKYREGWKFEPEVYEVDMKYGLNPIEEDLRIFNINRPHFVEDQYYFTILVNKTYTYEQMVKIAQDRWYKYISEQKELPSEQKELPKSEEYTISKAQELIKDLDLLDLTDKYDKIEFKDEVLKKDGD